MTLRPYQLEAHQATMAWLRRSVEPCVIEAPTGSGKSHIIAAIAAELHRISNGKHVLCLAPSSELVTQNREKYRATGQPASMFSASAGEISLRHPVVFGTPGTVKNKVRRFGHEFCAVILDEAHRITPTVKHIIEKIREQNDKLRVIGLSATPYRLGTGYIYANDLRGNPVPETQAREPYFRQLIYSISAHYLIDQGYLTPPVIGGINADSYETKGLHLNSRGQFDAADIDRAFHGHGRKTSRIIADVVNQSRDRCGVMIFAATIQHAQECMASLPPGLSALVTGKTPKAERENILKRFKTRELKYLVNVQVLTTGFDAPHVDVIALLRATESVSLLQQIVGRGLRIDDDKKDCLVLDYAENIERHCPDGDIFDPDIRVSISTGGGEELVALCPDCETPNTFAARKNDDGFEIDDYGYFVDLNGQRIKTEHGDMPAHYGRRCYGGEIKTGVWERCRYRWTTKECPHCAVENDIAARYCTDCKGEIVDPNEKLRIEFKQLKRDPTRVQTDEVLQMEIQHSTTRSMQNCLVVSFTTPYRNFTIWLLPEHKSEYIRSHYTKFMEATQDGSVQPKTVTYKKDPDSGFYRLIAINRAPDVDPAKEASE